MDLVLNAIETGHQQGRETQIGVGDRIGEARLDAARLVGRHVRHANRSRTVLGRVGQLGRRLVVRHQALVGIGTRVGDRVQRLGMLDDPADIEQGRFRQTGVTVTGKGVLAVLPDRLVNVHTGTIVANDRLRHEGGGLAILMGDVMHHVLQLLRPVCALDQRVEQGSDLALAGRGDFVVVHFHRHADRLQRQHHRRADVVQAIDRRHREITTLDARTVAGTAFTLGFLATRPGRFVREDLQRAARHVDAPGNRVENEELGLRTKVGRVADTA